MKKTPHVIWVCPSSEFFFRSKGAVQCRPNSVLPKLSEQGLRINVLIPFNAALLPKTKLTASRITRSVIQLAEKIPVEFVKLTKGEANPGIFMLKTPALEPAIDSAVFSKAAIKLAEQLKKPVDIFHLFNWKSSLLPLFVELEKAGAALFKNARTFLNITQIGHEGNFSPTLLPRIGVPDTLFHPDGIEFYGQVSYLKTGLLFADGIGLVDGRHINGAMHNKARAQYEGIFETQMFKLRRWASDHSLRAYLDAYHELLRLPKSKPLLDSLMKRLHPDADAAQHFINSWGPLPRDHYGANQIGFLIQAPQKAYTFWEWSGDEMVDFGIEVTHFGSGRTTLLGRGLSFVGEFWLDVEPDQEYQVELVGWTPSGERRGLLRSKRVRTPRMGPSANTMATLIDTSTGERTTLEGSELSMGEAWSRWGGGSSGFMGASGRFGSSNVVDWGQQ